MVGVTPDFDTDWTHRREFSNAGNGLRRGAESGVYLGVQARWRIGGGFGILRDFSRLSASAGGSVICHTVPFGLDN